MRLVSEPAQRIDDIGRCLAILPAHGHAARRQVDADIGNACDLAERLLDILDAEAAVNAGNRQVELAQAVSKRAACDLHFICRDGLNNGHHSRILDAAAHSILPSLTRTRMI